MLLKIFIGIKIGLLQRPLHDWNLIFLKKFQDFCQRGATCLRTEDDIEGDWGVSIDMLKYVDSFWTINFALAISQCRCTILLFICEEVKTNLTRSHFRGAPFLPRASQTTRPKIRRTFLLKALHLQSLDSSISAVNTAPTL